LRAVREIWADGTEARTRGDLLYLLYVAVLSVPVLVVPLLRMLGMGLARPDVLAVLLAGSAPQVVGAALPLAGALALLVGAGGARAAGGAGLGLAGRARCPLLGCGGRRGLKLEPAPRRRLVRAVTAAAAVAPWQRVPLLRRAGDRAGHGATTLPWAIEMLLGG